jgi:hypothetical protein
LEPDAPRAAQRLIAVKLLAAESSAHRLCAGEGALVTPEAARRACTAAGLVVLSAEVVGRQVCVSCAPLPAKPQVETFIGRLAKRGLAFTLSFGDGRGNVRVLFMATEGQ